MGYKWSEFKLEPQIIERKIMINDTLEVAVRGYLPIGDKIDLINYVINHAYCNPIYPEYEAIREEVFFSIALVNKYTDIEFSEEDLQAPYSLYDVLETNYIIDKVIGAIPKEEFNYLQTLLRETIRKRKEREKGGTIYETSIVK